MMNDIILVEQYHGSALVHLAKYTSCLVARKECKVVFKQTISGIAKIMTKKLPGFDYPTVQQCRKIGQQTTSRCKRCLHWNGHLW